MIEFCIVSFVLYLIFLIKVVFVVEKSDIIN